MSEPKPFASLSPSLLARKGSARPAMRPQIQPLHQYHDVLARQEQEQEHPGWHDLGWNDMGHDEAPAAVAVSAPVAVGVPAAVVAPQPKPAAPAPMAEVVSITPAEPVQPAVIPEVVRQREEIAARVAGAPRTPRGGRRSALAEGRRAAFTLRVDAERHLKLRLACTLRNRSAQQLLTEALDSLLAELPDVSALAAQVATKR